MASNSRSIWLAAAAPLAVVSWASVLTGSAYGQSLIIPDATLGSESSQVVNTSEINGLPSELITGGAQRGPNLFHSFLEFNIADGQQVYFANPTGVDNIFSRITGTNTSEIFGTLGIDGTANLFLLNPNGLVFGPNARLDIEGSFLASTADAIAFEEGGEFSAVAPQTAPLLTVSVPLGLQHGEVAAGAEISNQGNLAAGQDLTLAADQLNLQGQLWAGGELRLLGTEHLQIRDESDRPFIAAARGNLLVEGTEKVDIFALNHPDSGLFAGGNLLLRSANSVSGDAHYWTGGHFRIEQLDESLGNLSSPNDPIIRSLGNVSFNTYEGTSLHVLAGGAIDIGTVIITGPAFGEVGTTFLRETVRLSDGTNIFVDGSVQPTLDLRAGMLPEAIGSPSVTGISEVANFELLLSELQDVTSSSITIGRALIDAPNGLVLITNQYEPNMNLVDGTISLAAEDDSTTYLEAGSFDGKGGSIFIDSRSNISIINAFLNTSSTETPGDIALIAEDTVAFDVNADLVGGAFSDVLGGGEGSGGDIRVTSRNLELRNGSILSASVFGIGNSGRVLINVSETALLDGFNPNNGFPSWILSGIEFGGEGRSGGIFVTAKNLQVTNGARIEASVFGFGEAGEIRVDISETARFESFNSLTSRPSGLFGDVQALFFQDGSIVQAQGIGSNIILSAQNLEVADGAQLSSTLFGIGEAGDIVLNLSDTAYFDGFNSLTSNPSGAFSRIEESGQGFGGDVRVSAQNLVVMNGAELDASVYGIGDAGNVILAISEDALFIGMNSLNNFPSRAFSVLGRDASGQGGDVMIMTENLVVINGAQISAGSFGVGNAGNVVIQATDQISLGGSLSGVYSSIESEAQGAGGDIKITSSRLDISGGAQISAGSFGSGDAGNITIQVEDTARFKDPSSGVFSSTESDRSGSGGNIQITANILELLDEARLSVASSSTGNAGDIVLNIGEGLFASNGTVEASAESSSGGRIIIFSEIIRLFGNSDIQTSVSLGEGSGGDINLTADSILAFYDSDILAFAQDGQGGNIILDTAAFFGENYQPSPEGINPFTLGSNGRVDINASGAISGVITIPDVSFVEDSLTSLPDTVVDTNQLIAGSCIARTDTGGSFIVSGRGGLPDRPSEIFTAPYSTGSIRPLPADGSAAVEDDSTAGWQPGDPIVEPEGLFQLPDGRLVASRTCTFN
ncbi:hypothetical protein C7293_16870 [filamentous cyanobacterium CCT1]|nr:hypothetical protein C7293_16870 [filamentous cyanobacterium CCT1]PSN79966.1 hypothetical protein C8B47_08925 [filamentous cyanobacterium CCP4]